jgi:hypothetical protein
VARAQRAGSGIKRSASAPGKCHRIRALRNNCLSSCRNSTAGRLFHSPAAVGRLHNIQACQSLRRTRCVVRRRIEIAGQCVLTAAGDCCLSPLVADTTVSGGP